MTTEKPGCLAALFGIKYKQANQRTPDTQSVALPYRLSPQFFSPAEANFYRILKQLIGDKLLIFPKMALKEFLFVTDQANFQSHYNRIDRKHVDFLLCDQDTLQPVFAIELDDSSHRQAQRNQRDIFIETTLAKACLPLIRVPARRSYNTQELESLINNAIQKRQIHQAAQKNGEQVAKNLENPPLCPTHGIQMVLRTAKHGVNAGGNFWGCPNYPQCREIIKIS